MAPAGTPPEVAQALLPALQKAARNAQIAARLLPLGLMQAWVPAEKLGTEITEEYEIVVERSRRMGKKPQAARRSRLSHLRGVGRADYT